MEENPQLSCNRCHALTPCPSPKGRGETHEAPSETQDSCDALLLVSFGAPDGPDDVGPFLENVARRRRIPPERLREAAKQYEVLGGRSPANEQMRAIRSATVEELNAHGPRLPVYWGNRNWRPLLTDVVRRMADDGVRHAFALVTSAFGSYPTCRQYREDIERAREAVGPRAPRIDKLRLFYNHPDFIIAAADRVAEAFDGVSIERRDRVKLLFTAHSLPVAMASRAPYERQLRETCRLVVERLMSRPRLVDTSGATAGLSSSADATVGQANRGTHQFRPVGAPAASSPLTAHGLADWELAFQSRSGPPSQPWLGPNIGRRIDQWRNGEVEDLVVVPIGFLTDNKETVYDLDIEARRHCQQRGIQMVRARTVGDHPRIARMIRGLVMERLDASSPRLALGDDGPWPDECPAGCCERGDA